MTSTMCNIRYVILKILTFVIFANYKNLLINTSISCGAEKIHYISTEHPNITYFNPLYLKNVSLTSQRYERGNPFYYVGFHVIFLQTVNYNISLDFYFFEYLSNVYKRSFVEMHFEMCSMIQNDVFFGAALKQGKFASPCPYLPLDFYFFEYLSNVYKRSFVEMHFEMCSMIQNDVFFGAALKQGKFASPCPYLPGEYHFYNMTINPKIIPSGFPFRKGRIYCNASSTDTKDLIASGHIDMELKEINVKKIKWWKKP